MNQVIMLRFRDLVTEPGGTIIEHQSLIKSYDEVWWGWWMREHEVPPRNFLAEMKVHIEKSKRFTALLYDASRQLFYKAAVADIKLSPTRSGITSPEPAKSPEYYHRGRYPVWFLLQTIEKVDFENLRLRYHSVPSNSFENNKYKSYRGNKINSIEGESGNNGTINSLKHLRNIDATMWVLTDNISE